MASFLIVDDDELILKVTRSILQKAGHTVVVAKDGHAALEELNKELFSMIITDANMPNGISGFTLVSTIRKINRYSQVPIMFLIGRKDKTDVARAIESGVDDYVVKPIDPDLFLAKIESLISKKNDSYGFRIAPVKFAANWSLDIEVIGLSEQGLELLSKTTIPNNTKLRVHSEQFEKIGILNPQVRIVKCSQVDENFKIEASFVGLTEAHLQMIRKWLLSQNNLSKTG